MTAAECLCVPGWNLAKRGPIQEGGDQKLVAVLGDEQGEGKGGEDSEGKELQKRTVEVQECCTDK